MAPLQPKKRALSTERSRLCRQRQKAYADDLARRVQLLRRELVSLSLLRDVRVEQALRSPADAAARLIKEYCSLFQHGIRPVEALDASASPSSAKRARPAASISPALLPDSPTDVQREFLSSVMSPMLEVQDWSGRLAIGLDTLANGWKAWAAWHDTLNYELRRVHVVETGNDALVVQAEAQLHVVVSDTTIARLFPHVAGHETLVRRLLGREIVYEMRDTFFFSALERRVVKYSCDMDFVAALLPVAGDLETALFLVAPPEGDSLSDLAIRTTPAACANRSPLDINFLLS